ncbi:Transcriptional regulator, Crp/Fnr family [Candidatus Terasakiella magnetica]|uniref:Transcriptional regulator, Crp/Fnr family n=1 Tax=Candidatus Terasakiella magnetica TaxID=1867952 RepID=A0A1C3RC46_9PROT|nr:Crp/Fnr family transcriptional regulator [Candidatus Terasakiella magnetica]SCA54818.1 Transcriptional regulator, Crp/Fnr family [Candidatus Terasakiella magnetica]
MENQAIANAWTGISSCESCGIRHLALFADLEHDDFELIHKPIMEVNKSTGESLYGEGDDATHLYTVRSGVIKLTHYLPDGGQRIVRLLRTGDVAGLEALVNPTYEHYATVLRDAELCQIPRDVVERLNKETPRIHSQLLARWHTAVQQADEWLTELSTGSSKSRVARLVIGLSDKGDNSCHLFSREDLGAILGVTTETTSRIIAEFKRDGSLKDLGKNHFRADLPKLETIANEN